jgi:fucose permease
MKKNYKKTLLACYLGFITQAIAANFAPLLFITFYKTFDISFGKLALIPTCFYITQIIIDFACTKFVDKIGYRISIILSEITSAIGLFGLAFLPNLLPSPFIGVIICTIIYAIGSGLIEVLCSPIVEACPFENKAGMMSLLHSFYCWGAVGVILGSTIFFSIFGLEHWRILSCIWALIPLYNIYNFATCPIEPIIEDGKGMTFKELFKTNIFWILIVLMICAGSSEAVIAQWSSAFVESSLNISKNIGDLAGPCGFALFMGVSRVLYVKLNKKVDLTVFMALSGLLCFCCYFIAGLTSIPILGLIACMLCGFSVGIMWPGSISISSSILPKGGTIMFALLALAGDLGGSVGPMIVGNVSQIAGDNLQLGILSGIGFPIVLGISAVIIKNWKKSRIIH